jgi:hypothetical protein
VAQCIICNIAWWYTRVESKTVRIIDHYWLSLAHVPGIIRTFTLTSQRGFRIHLLWRLPSPPFPITTSIPPPPNKR